MTILRRVTFLAGAAMLVTLAAQNANGSTLLLSLDVQFLLLAGGVFGVAWGLGDGEVRIGAQRTMPVQRIPIILLLITLLALVLRLWQLETSVHYFVDELNFVSGVLDIVHARQTGEMLHLTHPFHWLAAFPRIFPYWQSWGTAIAGQTYTGLRLPSAVLGTLTVPAVYLLGKNLFDKRVGIMAALLLATFPPHIHFSRLGLNNIADPLFGTLAFAFAARGLKEGRRGDFAWAGAMLGMTQYFYEGGRLVYPVVMGLWLVFSPPRRVQQTATETNSTSQRGRIAWSHILTFLLTFALVALSFYTVAITFNLGLTPRLDSKSLPPEYWEVLLLSPAENGMLAAHLNYVLRTFAIYFTLPDQSFYYAGPSALVLPYLLPPLLMGIGWVLRHGGRALLLILVLAALGNSLLRYSPWASGFVVTFPILCVLMAVGLREIGSWLQRRGLVVAEKQRLAAVTAIVGVLCLGQIGYYFGIHLQSFNQNNRPIPDTHDAIYRALDFPPNTYVHLVGNIVLYDFDIARFQEYFGRPDLRTDVVREVGRSTHFNAEYLEALPRDADHAFFFAADAVEDAALLRQYFEVEGPFYTPYNVPPEHELILYYAAVP